MFQCPKCGSHSISGPCYQKVPCPIDGVAEHLTYRCLQCGYEESRPCHDAKEGGSAYELRADTSLAASMKKHGVKP